MNPTDPSSTRTGTGRRVGLSHDAVITAALRLADGEGLDALSMRRLGADPAQSSAIFLIMITDGVSFFVLLGLTAILI